MSRVAFILAVILIALTAGPRTTSAAVSEDIIYASFACASDGSVVTALSWRAVYPGTVEIALEGSYWEDFELGYYPTVWFEDRSTTAFSWDALLARRLHFVRIARVLADGYRLYSRPQFFWTPDCPQPARTVSTSNSDNTAPNSATSSSDRAGCDGSYATVCIPSGPPYLVCSDVPARNFPVRGRDPHGFDADKDGIGCEW